MYFPEDESIAKFLQHDFSPARVNIDVGQKPICKVLYKTYAVL